MSRMVKKIIRQLVDQGLDIPADGWSLVRCYPNPTQQSDGAWSWILINDNSSYTLGGYDLASECAKECIYRHTRIDAHGDVDIYSHRET